MAELQQTEKRTLRYDFTAVEAHDHGVELAKATQELREIEEEKKSISSSYKAKIDEKKARTNVLSQMVTNGWEMRDIECRIEYNQPQEGKKTIYRADNGRRVGVEAMTDYEWNLFNQPKGDPKEEEESFPDDTEDADYEETDTKGLPGSRKQIGY